jgi:hypothetical protein
LSLVNNGGLLLTISPHSPMAYSCLARFETRGGLMSSFPASFRCVT